MEWSESPLGVKFLRDRATGAEHWTVCAGVAAAREQLAPVAIAAPVVVAPVAPSAPETDADGYPLGYAESVAAELEYADAMHETERGKFAPVVEWPELRRAILAQGGIGPSPDWERDWYPGDLYRINGKAPDLVAAETFLGRSIPWASPADGNGTPSDSAMFDYLHRAWAEWQRSQEARRPRARKPAATAPAAALRTPAPVASERALLLDVARVVADVADLVAAATTDAERQRFAAMARQAAQLAQLVAADE